MSDTADKVPPFAEKDAGRKAALHSIWREAAEKRIDAGIDWPSIVLSLLNDNHRLRERIHSAATKAINSVYGTDDKHAYMGLRIAQNVMDGTPLPWLWNALCDHGYPPVNSDGTCPSCGKTRVTSPGAES